MGEVPATSIPAIPRQMKALKKFSAELDSNDFRHTDKIFVNALLLNTHIYDSKI